MWAIAWFIIGFALSIWIDNVALGESNLRDDLVLSELGCFAGGVWVYGGETAFSAKSHHQRNNVIKHLTDDSEEDCQQLIV